MCARRFLMVIALLTLLVVAGAFALHQFGQQALVEMATPKGEFIAPPPHSGPDYADPKNWIARPGMDERSDPSRWRPDGFPPPQLTPRRAAAFYIHPTTYLERDRWNALLDHGPSQQRAELFVRSQASAFAHVAEVWAPRYRQAAYGAFLLDDDDAQLALDFAYADVAAAFEEFLKQVPARQPIILAGHSQGALHLSRLLRDKVAGKPLADRIAAAYVVGWPLSLTADIPAMGLPACRTAEQAGCIVSWQSFAEPANVSLITDVYEGSTGPTGIERRREDMLCINPISGTIDGEAEPAANLGTLVPTADLTSAALVPGRVGARCDDGFLMLTGELPLMGPYVLPGNNYHVYDFALFWGSIRADAGRRLAAWRR